MSLSLTALLFASEMTLVYCHYYIQVNPTPAVIVDARYPETSSVHCQVLCPLKKVGKNTFPRSNLVEHGRKMSKYIGYIRLLPAMACVHYVLPSGDYNASYAKPPIHRVSGSIGMYIFNVVIKIKFYSILFYSIILYSNDPSRCLYSVRHVWLSSFLRNGTTAYLMHSDPCVMSLHQVFRLV